jgi:hypothetical protein
MQRRRWQTESSRKLRVSHFTASFAQKFAKLTFKRACHTPSLPKRSFRMSNICFTAGPIPESPARLNRYFSGFRKIFANFGR